MNKAAFIYTFLRLNNTGVLSSLVFWIIVIPVGIAGCCWWDKHFGSHISLTNATLAMEQCATFFSHPMVVVVTVMLLVGCTVGNTKALHDGEYFPLTFTRPLSRFSYVFSRWLAGSLATLLTINLQIFFLAISFYGLLHITTYPLGLTHITNLVLNSLGMTALMVLIKCCPPNIAVRLLVLFLICVLSSPYTIGYSHISRPVVYHGPVPLWWSILCNIFATIWDTICDKIYPVIQDFLTPFIDVTPYFNSIELWWLPLISFFSNLVLYLWLAVLVLNWREFFYANE